MISFNRNVSCSEECLKRWYTTEEKFFSPVSVFYLFFSGVSAEIAWELEHMSFASFQRNKRKNVFSLVFAVWFTWSALPAQNERGQEAERYYLVLAFATRQ